MKELKRHLCKPFGPQIPICNSGSALFAFSLSETTCKRCIDLYAKRYVRKETA